MKLIWSYIFIFNLVFVKSLIISIPEISIFQKEKIFDKNEILERIDLIYRINFLSDTNIFLSQSTIKKITEFQQINIDEFPTLGFTRFLKYNKNDSIRLLTKFEKSSFCSKEKLVNFKLRKTQEIYIKVNLINMSNHLNSYFQEDSSEFSRNEMNGKNQPVVILRLYYKGISLPIETYYENIKLDLK